jgi:hypothetical protein
MQMMQVMHSAHGNSDVLSAQPTRKVLRPQSSDRHFDGLHDPVGFRENFNDPLVMLDVVKAEFSALAVFQPFCVGWYEQDSVRPDAGRKCNTFVKIQRRPLIISINRPK